jgi:hypothetical protein
MISITTKDFLSTNTKQWIHHLEKIIALHSLTWPFAFHKEDVSPKMEFAETSQTQKDSVIVGTDLSQIVQTKDMSSLMTKSQLIQSWLYLLKIAHQPKKSLTKLTSIKTERLASKNSLIIRHSAEITDNPFHAIQITKLSRQLQKQRNKQKLKLVGAASIKQHAKPLHAFGSSSRSTTKNLVACSVQPTPNKRLAHKNSASQKVLPVLKKNAQNS